MKSSMSVFAGVFMIIASISVMVDMPVSAQTFAFMAVCVALLDIADTIRSRKE